MNKIRRFKTNLLFFAFVFPILSSHAFADAIGTQEWEYEVSKSIAASLADTAYWNQALPYFRDLSAHTQDWNVLLLHAKVELQRGNTDSAQDAIDRALSIHPDNPRLLLMAGDIAADRHQIEAAVEKYDRVLTLQPQNERALLHLARQVFALRRWQRVIELYESYLSTHEPTSEILVRLSAAYENLGEIRRAERCLLDNLALHNNKALAYLPLERFYKRQNDETRLKEILKERMKYQKNEDNRNLRQLLPSSR